MPTLLETQTALCRAILSGNCSEATGLIAPGCINPEEALAIYRGTFIAAATKALRLTYPAVERLTGAEFFENAAAEFISHTPPNSGCLDDYGSAFGDFLATFAPAACLPYLADVARLEWAVNNALRAADVAALQCEALSAAGMIDPAKLILKPHPSLALLKVQFPADTIWRAVLQEDDAALAAITLTGGPFFLLITREEDGVQVERLPEPIWQFLSSLCAGKSFAESFDAGPAREISTVLAHCLTRGRFIAIGETTS